MNCFNFFSLVTLFSSFLSSLPEIGMRIDHLHKKIKLLHPGRKKLGNNLSKTQNAGTTLILAQYSFKCVLTLQIKLNH